MTVADIATLRKSHPPDIVHAALTLAQLQKKARHKFPDLPFTWAVPEALEQATDARVAAHKAARFAALHPEKILDLCAGIGGDTMALAKIAPTTAYDLSPIRTTCLRYNLDSLGLSADIRTEDIRTLLATPPIKNQKSKIENPPTFFHIATARGSGGEGSPAVQGLIPGPDLLLPLISQFPAGALKLSPAVDFDSLPPGHLEIISRNRTVVQAVLWTGTLADPFAHGTRTATVIEDDGQILSYTARPKPPELTAAVASYLFEADPALTRAGVAAALGAELRLGALTVDGGYLTGSEPLHHAAVVAFRVILTIPYSQERVTAALSHLPPADPGPVEVKTRGGIPGINTDQLQLIWSAATTSRRTVLIYRLTGDTVATLAERI